MAETAGSGRQVGVQTLARGLTALYAVVESDQPMTISQVAEVLGTHRTIAYRILVTLVEFRLLRRGEDGRYSAGAGLAGLAEHFHAQLREAAMPVLREVADDLAATVALIVAEGPEAVAIAVVEPKSVDFHLTFKRGSRHPLDRGSAGYALLSAGPPVDDEPEAVTRARERGYALSKGEVEPNAYGVAVPLKAPSLTARACLNLITYREDVATAAPERMMLAVAQLSGKLA